MQVAETKTSSAAQNLVKTKRQPFFNQEGQGDFFSKSSESATSFFSPTTIQPKLTVGQPNDKYEVEADAMADKVVQRLSINDNPVHQISSNGNTALQTKCEECDEEEKIQEKEEEGVELKPIFESNGEQPEAELQTKPIGFPVIQRKCSSCEEEEIQAKAEGTITGDTSRLESKLSSNKGSGNPLSPKIENTMGNAFGTDFSGVKVHTGNDAVQMNRQLGAQAFTHGKDIYFNQGKYDTNSHSGKHLLAHELTHTVQQGLINLSIQKQDPESNLASLNEMLDSFDVPEEEVIAQCAVLSDPEKLIVRTEASYKNRMANALDVSEMVRAINNLNLSLDKKLEWVQQAALFGTTFLDYSTIKPWITDTTTTQEARNLLKINPTVGLNYFIGVCTNETMVEALDDLQFDLVTKLTWLKAEMTITSWELDYLTIKPWIVHANTTQLERESLKTDITVGMGFFVDVCTNKTIVEALNDLKYDLVTKLTWINAEMTITSWELNYSTLKRWVIDASTTQIDRDALKDPVWKAFFVAVCDKTTIIEAVTDLNFGILTQLDWINAEGVDFIVKLTWLLNHSTDYDIIRNEITIASASEKQTALADTTIRNLINSKLTAPVSVAVFSHLLLSSMYWKNPKNNEFFAYFVTNGGTGTLPSAATMNCWESIMYAAYLANKINAAWIKSFYNTAFGASDPNVLIWSQLGWNSGLPTYPGTTPTVGQLIFYTESGRPYPGHVAMAIDSTHAISLWSQPNNDYFIQRVNITAFSGVPQISNPPW